MILQFSRADVSFQISERLAEGAERVDVPSDIQTTVVMRGTGPNIPEQILPDFYVRYFIFNNV